MRGKFTLTCRACGCSAELNISERPLTAYVCQSCGQKLAYEDRNRLSVAMEALYALPEFTTEDGFIPEGSGFQIRLDPHPSDDPIE